jgi:hypothetical protein
MRGGNHLPWVPEHAVYDRFIDPEKEPGDRVFFFGVNLPDEHRVRRRGQPVRLEFIRIEPGKEHPDGGVEGYREDCGDCHGEVLAVCKGFEEAAFLVDESEDRQKRDGDYKQ